MRQLVYGQEETIIPWAEERANSSFRVPAKAIGIAESGVLRGAFIYDTFSTTGCMMHVASDGTATWLGRDFTAVLVPVFAFPFLQCAYPRVTAMVAESNARSRRLVTRLGGKQEGVLRKAARSGEDLIVYGMLRDECRWLPPLAGQGAPLAV